MPKLVGIQTMVIIDPYGMTFHAVGVFCLDSWFLFKSGSSYCGWKDLLYFTTLETYREQDEDDVEGKQWMFCHVPGCSFWTSKSFRMQRHKLCHSEPSELEVKRCYKCPDCHLKFYSLAKLLKHDRRKHTGIKDYECRICGAEVTDIQTHMRVRMITK